jgi:hypothetical protein
MGPSKAVMDLDRLVQQASLDRLPKDRQLQYRFASHETFFHQFQLLEPLNDLFRAACPRPTNPCRLFSAGGKTRSLSAHPAACV